MYRNTCKNCGLPFKPGETHGSNCEESFDDEETWIISPEELAEKAERIRQYKNKNQSGDTRNAKK